MADMKPAFKQNGFGILLRTRRWEMGLKLIDLAAATGLSVGYLSQIERDLCEPPSLGKVELIAKIMGGNLADWVRLSGRIPEDILDELGR